ncbi:MAG: hypothetical protein AAFU54_11320 [Chloroflexota bacterium]
MSDQYSDYNPDADDQTPLSPIHPKRPEAFEIDPDPQPTEADPARARRWATEPNSPRERLQHLRDKMEQVANEYANREISRAQFNAIHSHYSEQRAIVEAIIARDPSNDGWKQASRSGKTTFLREHFEAKPVNYVIYLHKQGRPLMGGGTRPDMQHISSILKKLWGMQKIRMGAAIITLKPPHWLVIAIGRYGVTFVTYYMEPTSIHTTTVNDLHQNFERANRIMLERGRVNKSQMVFPQRSLIENKSM